MPRGQDSRRYHICPECRLLFVHPGDHPEANEEKERYLLHNNGIQYPGYVRFLKQAIDPTLPYLAPKSRGLDYGCGPVPTLSLLMQSKGHTCLDYDPFFFPKLPTGPFDYLFATEAAEHFFYPGAEFTRIGSLLKPGGILTLMTVFWHHTDDLLQNFYFRDPSHVVFYHPDTLDRIQHLYGFSRLYCDNKRVVILKKK